MHPVASKYFRLSEDKQMLVQIELCDRANEAWGNYTKERGPVSYRESVTGTMQAVDVTLPSDAIEAVKNRTDAKSVSRRYLEPVAAMQDQDLSWSDEMDLAYYAIYNLYRFHIAGTLSDSWIIVNQALSALGKEEAVDNLEQAIEGVA
jgi:hypothetical protein